MAFTMSDALAIRHCDPELRNFVKSGGRTSTGREQRVRADAGFWTVSFEFVATNEERVNAYRGMIARLRQGEQIIARICDRYRPTTRKRSTLGAAAALRATSVYVLGALDDLDPGQHFSIGQRLYRVTEVQPQSDVAIGLVAGLYDDGAWNDNDVWIDNAPIRSMVKFVPPLRAAAPNGATVEFENLTLLCEIDSINDGDLSLDLGRHGNPTLTRSA